MAPNAEAYLRRVDRELRALELRIYRLTLTEVHRAFAVIRAHLATLPDDALSRPLAYKLLRPRLEDALVPLNDGLASLLALELWNFQRRARALAARYAGTADPNAPLAYPAEIMRRVRFLGRSLDAYFRRHSPSQFMREILRIADRTIQRGLLEGTPTADLLQQVLPEVTRRGQPTLVIRRGTVAHAALTRINALITAAVWDHFTRESRPVWQSAPNISYWEWHAVLDPRTCPVCRPLDGQRRSTPTDFPSIPPVHPHCRCAILPVFV